MPVVRKAFATFSLEQLALGLVLLEPSHGYRLYTHYRASFGSIWTVGRSKFYAALANLHEQRYLSATTELQADRPSRKIYTVTGAGRDSFDEWLHRPVTPMRAVRVEFVAKLRFFDLLDAPGALDLVEAQLALCAATRDRWARRLAAMDHAATEQAGAADAEAPPEPRLAEAGATETGLAEACDPFMNVVYDFRLRQAQFIIEWLQACRTRLERGPAR